MLFANDCLYGCKYGWRVVIYLNKRHYTIVVLNLQPAFIIDGNLGKIFANGDFYDIMPMHWLITSVRCKTLLCIKTPHWLEGCDICK